MLIREEMIIEELKNSSFGSKVIYKPGMRRADADLSVMTGYILVNDKDPRAAALARLIASHFAHNGYIATAHKCQIRIERLEK